MSPRVMTAATILLVLALAVTAGPCLGASIVLDDSETGAGAWHTNDAQVAGEAPSEICGIYTVAHQTEEGNHVRQAHTSLTAWQPARVR